MEYLNSTSVPKISDFDASTIDNLTLNELLHNEPSPKSKHNSHTINLSLNVLDKFINEDESDKPDNKKNKFLDFYKLMLDIAENHDAIGRSSINKFDEIQKKFEDKSTVIIISIALIWGLSSGAIWGLAFLGELFLGKYIAQEM